MVVPYIGVLCFAVQYCYPAYESILLLVQEKPAAGEGNSRKLLAHSEDVSQVDARVIQLAVHAQPEAETESAASEETAEKDASAEPESTTEDEAAEKDASAEPESATEDEAAEKDASAEPESAPEDEAADSEPSSESIDNGIEGDAKVAADEVGTQTSETVNGDAKEGTALSAKEAAAESNNVPQKSSLLNTYLNGLSNWQDGFSGSEVVSVVCAKHKAEKACSEHLGCQWAASRQRCEDASQWHCTTKKSVTDCIAQRELSPGYPGNDPGSMTLPVRADKLCGKLLFGQKKKVYKQCKFGFRSKHSCSSNADCPGSECVDYSTVDGCATTIRSQCGSMGWQQLAWIGVASALLFSRPCFCIQPGSRACTCDCRLR